MAGFDYAKMRGTATRLLTRFNQGTIQLLRETQDASDPATPWIPGAPSRELITLQGTVAAVTVDQANARYLDGALILAGDLVVTIEASAADPAMTDMVVIDGAARAIRKIVKLPAAGVTVAIKMFVSGDGAVDASMLQPMLDFTYPANSQYLSLF